VLDRGIGHIYNRPATPRLNCEIERSHRIDAEELCRMLDEVAIDDAGVFNERLHEWENFSQFQPTPRWTRRTDAIRTTAAENGQPGVTALRQLYS